MITKPLATCHVRTSFPSVKGQNPPLNSVQPSVTGTSGANIAASLGRTIIANTHDNAIRRLVHVKPVSVFARISALSFCTLVRASIVWRCLFTEGKEVLTWHVAKGFVITPLDTHLVSAIIGLYFGGSLAGHRG